MLDLSDTRWADLQGGYRVPYDPRPALARLERSECVAVAWEELWQGLHHQGDVGVASYAAVPHLLRVHQVRDVPDWNTFALVGLIEQVRYADHSPSLPLWLKDGYDTAWREIASLALRDLARSDDPTLAQAALGATAMARGLRRAGEILLEFTEDELAELISGCRGCSTN